MVVSDKIPRVSKSILCQISNIRYDFQSDVPATLPGVTRAGSHGRRTEAECRLDKLDTPDVFIL